MPAEDREPVGRRRATKNGARERGGAGKIHKSVMGARALLGKCLSIRAESRGNRCFFVILTSVLLNGRGKYNSQNKNSRTNVNIRKYNTQLSTTSDKCTLFDTIVNLVDVQMYIDSVQM